MSNYRSGYMSATHRASALFIGFLLVFTGFYILFNFFPFNMYGMPNTGESFMSWFYWLFLKYFMPFTFIGLGSFVFWGGIKG